MWSCATTNTTLAQRSYLAVARLTHSDKANVHSVNLSRATVRYDLWECVVSVAAQDYMFLLYSCDCKKSSSGLNISVAGEWWGQGK